jgi:hypothetical protein
MKHALIGIGLALLIAAAALTYWFVFRKDLTGSIVVPYIAHQKPRIDPHVPSANAIADKLDEVLFDGLFNVSANPSGVIYEDGLGEFISINEANAVTIRLKPGRKWHSSYNVTMEKKEISISGAQTKAFSAEDLRYTLERIRHLGSLSPDFILVSQAVPDLAFSGPDQDGLIQFQFRGDRIWSEGDIKEVLSFKVVPAGTSMDAAEYADGTGPYLRAGSYEETIFFRKSPGSSAKTQDFLLKPFVDNSTYTTELKNSNINVLLNTPFGALSPILGDTAKYFYKSSIATTFFAVFFNTRKLNLEQRLALRKLINNDIVMRRFFKMGTPQQRHIANYKGDPDNYDEYLNGSVFPTTSYYVEEQVVTPILERTGPDPSVLPDTVRIQTCLNYNFREELSDIAAIMNEPAMYNGKIRVSAVSNEEIALQNYDAVIVPVSGYRSNFMFDLYGIFLREPDFSALRINLKTRIDDKGATTADEASLEASRNFFALDSRSESPEQADAVQLLQYVYMFMSTREIGDKQACAQFVDQIDQRLALGAWMFSLPSLAYVKTQFDAYSIDMYGTASQLSTIEKWAEKPVR